MIRGMELKITQGSIEDVLKEIETRKKQNKEKLIGMKAGIYHAKQVLRELKHKRRTGLDNLGKTLVSEAINGQRDYIRVLEADYSNAYQGLPKYEQVPVRVYATGGSVLIDWKFLQSFLRKLKGFDVLYVAVAE